MISFSVAQSNYGVFGLISEGIHHHLHSICIDVIRARDEILLSQVGELRGETLFVESFLWRACLMLNHVEWDYNLVIAGLFAANLVCAFLLVAFMLAQIVVELHYSLEATLNVSKLGLVKNLFLQPFSFVLL